MTADPKRWAAAQSRYLAARADHDAARAALDRAADELAEAGVDRGLMPGPTPHRENLVDLRRDIDNNPRSTSNA
jgi:hypothetical protein